MVLKLTLERPGIIKPALIQQSIEVLIDIIKVALVQIVKRKSKRIT